jgi:hypothetical protein
MYQVPTVRKQLKATSKKTNKAAVNTISNKGFAEPVNIEKVRFERPVFPLTVWQMQSSIDITEAYSKVVPEGLPGGDHYLLSNTTDVPLDSKAITQM